MFGSSLFALLFYSLVLTVCARALLQRKRLSSVREREQERVGVLLSCFPYQPTLLLHTRMHAVAVSHDAHEVKERELMLWFCAA